MHMIDPEYTSRHIVSANAKSRNHHVPETHASSCLSPRSWIDVFICILDLPKEEVLGGCGGWPRNAQSVVVHGPGLRTH
jgi:hypothetical protein